MQGYRDNIIYGTVFHRNISSGSALLYLNYNDIAG